MCLCVVWQTCELPAWKVHRTRAVHKEHVFWVLCWERCYNSYQAVISGVVSFYCLSKFGSFFLTHFFLVCQVTSHNPFKLTLRIWGFQDMFYIYLYKGSWVLVFELLVAQHIAGAQECFFNRTWECQMCFYWFWEMDPPHPQILGSCICLFLRRKNAWRI